ncbi:subtilase family protein [Stackebrandtia endophytica]|uniref:Subtilase family protein n=1 Tax=Stackebrandtia endophytica TaxID=1496996 RepID=A0A543AWM5_9ACTN|nr:S8 family serine peptidase [Stackebrandtia endophytica]TQL76981.1 subtilase family protein [Stackebrandtia endophytica]
MRRRIAAACLAAGLGLALVPGVAAADEIRDGQWYLDTLGINEAHQLSQGAGVTIGVIDSGVDATHPDLVNQVLPGIDLGTSEGDGLAPTADHGTATTSVLVGTGHGSNNADGILGIAPRAKVISVGVDWDSPGSFDNEWIPQAVQWLIDNGADIISITTTSAPGSSEVFKQARDNGIPVVASAGNTTDQEWGDGQLSGTLWPAREYNVIPVTGVDRNDQFWDESMTLNLAAPQPQLGLAAPAVDIPTAILNGGYDIKRGTSFSAPIVAGTLALIKSAYPDLDYQTLIARLIETVEDQGPEGYDDKYGWGIVNPLAALTEDVVFDDDYSSIESYADDRLSLEDQGQQSDDSTEPNGDQGPSAEPSDDQALTGSDTGTPLWIPIAITAAALLAAAVILTLILRKKRHRANTPSPHPPTQPGPAEQQCQSPPHP